MASLCKLDFPIYACEVLDDNHVIVCGGGGASKTGVPNAVDILKIQMVSKKLQADPVERLETGSNAAMNMAVLNKGIGKPFIIAVGLGGTCKVYSVQKKMRSNDQSSGTNVKNRKSPKQPRNVQGDEEAEHFEFTLLKTLETDFSASDPLQKVVRISRDCSIIATGGCDGYIRAWNVTDFSKRFFAKGHKDDVTDIDISPDGKYLVSVSRDGTAVIWNAESGMKETDLHSKWNSQMTTRNYRFRSCRYGVVIEDSKAYALFTTHSPIRSGRRSDSGAPQGCLTKWARKKLTDQSKSGSLAPVIMQCTGREAISSMCISCDGVYIGLGFMEGSIAIYIAFSLQCAKRFDNVHSIFVTGLSFLPPSDDIVAQSYDATLVSVSADNHCKLMRLSSRIEFDIWVALLLVFISAIAAVYILFQLGIV